MNIQWFPGHMTKALRMMQDNVALCDCAGYLLDARAPYSCLNPQFEKLLGNKPCVLILNKCDLAQEEITKEWLNYFRGLGHKTVAVSSVDGAQKRIVVDAFNSLALPLVEKFKAKGVYKPIRAMIIGVPNSGKSTLINCLASSKKTVTGDKPGVTKGKQWVRLAEGLELLDTPGTLWPKFEQQDVAKKLCYIGSIRDEVTDPVELAKSFLEDVMISHKHLICQRYKLSGEEEDLLSALCQNRGYLVKGGEIDIERGAKAVIDDFRKCKIGRITLERPQDIPKCLIEKTRPAKLPPQEEGQK